MKSLNQFITERDMVGWYSIPEPLKQDLKGLGLSQKSKGVKYVIEDDVLALFTKVIVNSGLPSREIEDYVRKNENVTLDTGHPVGGYTLIIKW